MKRLVANLILPLFVLALAGFAPALADKGKGEKCFVATECAFGLECSGGVCVKKPEFNFGGSGKSGKECQIDADCIGSGKCVEGNFGKKYCSG